MSDLQRSFAKAKLAGLPFEPPLPPMHVEDDEGEDDVDDLKPLPDPAQDDDSSSASSASSASSTGTIRPSPSKHLFARPKGFVKSITFQISSCTVMPSMCQHAVHSFMPYPMLSSLESHTLRESTILSVNFDPQILHWSKGFRTPSMERLLHSRAISKCFSPH